MSWLSWPGTSRAGSSLRTSLGDGLRASLRRFAPVAPTLVFCSLGVSRVGSSARTSLGAGSAAALRRFGPGVPTFVFEN